MDEEEVKTYLQEADPQDFYACLKENLEKDSDRYFAMLSTLYWNDKAHFNQLSAGCKVALVIYLNLKR